MSAYYQIPCVWQMCGYVTVEADSLAKAVAIAQAAGTPLPSDAEYLTDSFEIDREKIYGSNKHVFVGRPRKELA